MKKELTLILLLLCSLLVTAQEKQPLQQAIQPKDIYVTFDCVKHIVFPVQVNDIEIGQKDLVMASRLEEAPHVIRLSAQTEGFEEETNLTVVCIDGSVYTYTSVTFRQERRTGSPISTKTGTNGNITTTGQK